MDGRARVLVTGAGGFVGVNLAHRLLDEGYEITCLTRDPSGGLRLESLRGRARIVGCDLLDAPAVRRATADADPEVVFHLASTPFNPPTIAARTHLEVIALGTLNLLEAVAGRRGVRVVIAGSAAEYGGGSGLPEDAPLRPGTVLGAAKASATLLAQAYARLHGTETVVLRLFTPFGPWERSGRLVPHAVLSALRGEDVRMTSGEQQRDFLYVADVVDALVRAATNPLPGGTVLNICSGRGVRVRDLVEMVLDLMGRPVRALPGALPDRPDEIREVSGDNAAARALLGWEPRVPLDEGLRRSIAWITENRDLAEKLE